MRGNKQYSQTKQSHRVNKENKLDIDHLQIQSQNDVYHFNDTVITEQKKPQFSWEIYDSDGSIQERRSMILDRSPQSNKVNSPSERNILELNGSQNLENQKQRESRNSRNQLSIIKTPIGRLNNKDKSEVLSEIQELILRQQMNEGGSKNIKHRHSTTSTEKQIPIQREEKILQNKQISNIKFQKTQINQMIKIIEYSIISQQEREVKNKISTITAELRRMRLRPHSIKMLKSERNQDIHYRNIDRIKTITEQIRAQKKKFHQYETKRILIENYYKVSYNSDCNVKSKKRLSQETNHEHSSVDTSEKKNNSKSKNKRYKKQLSPQLPAEVYYKQTPYIPVIKTDRDVIVSLKDYINLLKDSIKHTKQYILKREDVLVKQKQFIKKQIEYTKQKITKIDSDRYRMNINPISLRTPPLNSSKRRNLSQKSIRVYQINPKIGKVNVFNSQEKSPLKFRSQLDTNRSDKMRKKKNLKFIQQSNETILFDEGNRTPIRQIQMNISNSYKGEAFLRQKHNQLQHDFELGAGEGQEYEEIIEKQRDAENEQYEMERQIRNQYFYS